MNSTSLRENQARYRLSQRDIERVRRSCSTEICHLLGIEKHPLPETIFTKFARAIKRYRDTHNSRRGHGRKRQNRLIRTQQREAR